MLFKYSPYSNSGVGRVRISNVFNLEQPNFLSCVKHKGGLVSMFNSLSSKSSFH